MEERKTRNKFILVFALSSIIFFIFSFSSLAIDINSDDNLGGVELQPVPVSLSYFYENADVPPQLITVNHSGSVSVIFGKGFSGSPRLNLLERGDNNYVLEFLIEEFAYWYNNLTDEYTSSSGGTGYTLKSLVDYYKAYELWEQCYISQYISGCTSIVQELVYNYNNSQLEQELFDKTTEIILKNERIKSLESYNEILTMENNSLNEQIVNLRNEYEGNYQLAYQNGYSKGFEEANWFERGLNSIFSSPSYMLHSFLNFEIFGINVLSIFLMVITLLIVGFIIKRFI